MYDLVCKHLINDICCNADCPVCCDFCPVYNYFEICKYAELVGEDQPEGGGEDA